MKLDRMILVVGAVLAAVVILVATVVLGMALPSITLAQNALVPATKPSVLPSPQVQIQGNIDRVAQEPAPLTPGPTSEMATVIARDGFWWNESVLRRIGPQVHETTANGLTVSASDFYAEAGRIYINLCVVDSQSVQRSFGSAPLDTGVGLVESFDGHLNTGSGGQACIAYEYKVDPDVKLSEVSATLNSVGLVPPPEGQECQEYAARSQSSQRLKDLEITVECRPVNGQSPELVVSRGKVTQEEAELIVTEEVLGVVEGPWAFGPYPSP